jgi:hypothetical protein
MFRNRPAIPCIVLGLAAAFLAGCSRGNSMDADEARSKRRSLRSLAAESEMFIDFALQGHASRRYAEEHTAYLEDAAEQLAKELERAAPQPDAEASVRDCQAKVSALDREFSRIRVAVLADDRDALAAARAKIARLRETLERTD